MSTTQTLSIATIGGSGPKATAVMFVKDSDGVRPWAWIGNDQADNLVPGMRLTVQVAGVLDIQRTYTKDGQTFELKVPRQQLLLTGEIVADAPEAAEIEPVTVVVTDAARAYAEAYRAKASRSTAPAEGDDAPF